MKTMKHGVPLAVILTVMDVWATLQFGVPIWSAWGLDPIARVGILALAGIASASLCHVWAQILGGNLFGRLPPATDASPRRLSTEDVNV